MVSTPAQFYVLRFLPGMAEAGFLPGVLFYLSGWSPSYRRGRIFSLFLLGLPLAGIVGEPLSGAVIHGLDSSLRLAGRQWLFLIEGIPSVILGIVVFRALPASLEQARWLPPLIRDTGVKDPLTIGLYTSIPNLCALVAMILISRSSDRHRDRRGGDGAAAARRAPPDAVAHPGLDRVGDRHRRGADLFQPACHLPARTRGSGRVRIGLLAR